MSHSGASVDDSGHGGLQMLVTAGAARFITDEPVDIGGLDLGPTPHQLVAAGLAACTSQTLRIYAKRKEWPLGAVHVDVEHQRDAAATPQDRFIRRISLSGPLDEEQRTRLLEIAERCPVHRMLTAGASVETTLTNPATAST